jgi:rhodanese-related sulfurtransferase
MSKKHNPGFLKVVDAAKARITEVTVDQVMARRQAGDNDFVLVDCREQSEWAAGHVAEAVYMGKGVIERDAEKTWPDLDTELVLYCGGGFRSALAADVLQTMGYTRVSSMDGGWRGWNAAGGPTTKD